MTWEALYQNKTQQRARGRARCAWCERRGSTQSHHLFRRRPDDPILQEEWNIVQLCIYCHSEESYEMQVGLGLRKLHECGPDYIRERIQALNNKVDHGLPSHFWDALDLYNQGRTP